MRLRVTFLLFDGLPLYPGLNAGPITTWMYGPVLPCLLFPATLGSTIDSALLIAGALNAGLLLSAFTFTTLLWPQPVNYRWPFAIRLLALSLSLLLLPQAFFVFLQADNAALACGLVSLTCLARAGVSNQSKWWWAAASFAGATVFSKLHGVAVPAAEIIWIWLYCSRGKALRFTLKLILVSASLSVATLMISGTASGAWEAIIRIPAKLPFATNWEKRLTEMTPYYFLMVILPGILVIFTGRQRHKNSPNLNLPIIAWLVSLPLGLAGTLSAGGSCNSLHGAFYLIPLALANLYSHHPIFHGRPLWLSLGIWMAVPTALIVAVGTSILPLPRNPDTTLPLEAVTLALKLNGRAWLPSRPLATRFATGRHDHDEDGLYVRQLTAFFPRRNHAYAYLPPEWNTTVFEQGGWNQLIALSMQPGSSTVQQIGRWTLVTQSSVSPPQNSNPSEWHDKPEASGE